MATGGGGAAILAPHILSLEAQAAEELRRQMEAGRARAEARQEATLREALERKVP